MAHSLPIAPALADWRADAMRPRHLYIHIPFCHRRCSYCDFNTYANMEHRIEAYVDALCAELGSMAAMPVSPPPPVPPPGAGLLAGSLRPSIFFGGGTPSMLSPAQLERLLEAAGAIVPLEGAEVTLEANPGTVLGRGYLRDLRGLGITRLSMGVQSLHDPTLRVLGRIHTAAEAYASFQDARAAGFDSINLDFIFGLPGQTVEGWHQALDTITTWGADHFSLYSLILEERTPLYAQVTSGSVRVPDDDATGAMYELAIERLAAAGYIQYEISNWARHDEVLSSKALSPKKGEELQGALLKTRTDDSAGRLSQLPSHACHHNMAYWLNVDYLGCGAGAHGHLYPRRYADALAIDAYIRQAQAGAPIAEVTELTPRDLAAETMFMGLRMLAGVGYAHFRARCGREMRSLFGVELAELEQQGLLQSDAVGVRLTERGRLFGNRVFERFV
jgi:oxygen-independent coproporphyrinogen-3 oxidase